jgi:TolB-like protein
VGCPHAAHADTPRILVQHIQSVGVDARLARSVEDALVLALGRHRSVSVVSPSEMRETIAYAKTQAELGCDVLDECIAEVQKKLRVQRLVAGKLSKLGSDFLLALSVIDLRSKTVSQRLTRNGADFPGLLSSVAGAADELLGGPGAQPTFKLALAHDQHLKLAVMPLAARGVQTATADAMTQILASELNQIAGLSVISRDDIQAMVEKVAVEGELGCTSNLECIVEIGAALGLSKLVTGTVGKVADTHVISLQLIDTRKAEVENRVLESFDGDVSELRNAIKLSAYQLVGVDYSQLTGAVEFGFSVKDATASLNGRAMMVKRSQLRLGQLTPGRYSLRVLADPEAYYPLQTDVYVAPYGANVRTFRLSEKPTPWYGKWWIWAVGAVVVAGAATAIVLAAQPAPSTGSGTVTLSATGM